MESGTLKSGSRKCRPACQKSFSVLQRILLMAGLTAIYFLPMAAAQTLSPVMLPTYASKTYGTGQTSVKAMSVDDIGNTYIVGTFRAASITIEGKNLSNVGVDGSTDIFVAKYDPLGNLGWAQRWGGRDDDIGVDIVVEPGGQNLYVTGLFKSKEIVLGNKPPVFKIKNAHYDGTGTPQLSTFLVKVASTGKVVWGMQTGTNGVASIALDMARRRIYLTGTSRSSWLNSYGDKLALDATPGVVDEWDQWAAEESDLSDDDEDTTALWFDFDGDRDFDDDDDYGAITEDWDELSDDAKWFDFNTDDEDTDDDPDSPAYIDQDGDAWDALNAEGPLPDDAEAMTGWFDFDGDGSQDDDDDDNTIIDQDGDEWDEDAAGSAEWFDFDGDGINDAVDDDDAFIDQDGDEWDNLSASGDATAAWFDFDGDGDIDETDALYIDQDGDEWDKLGDDDDAGAGWFDFGAPGQNDDDDSLIDQDGDQWSSLTDDTDDANEDWFDFGASGLDDDDDSLIDQDGDAWDQEALTDDDTDDGEWFDFGAPLQDDDDDSFVNQDGDAWDQSETASNTEWFDFDGGDTTDLATYVDQDTNTTTDRRFLPAATIPPATPLISAAENASADDDVYLEYYTMAGGQIIDGLAFEGNGNDRATDLCVDPSDGSPIVVGVFESAQFVVTEKSILNNTNANGSGAMGFAIKMDDATGDIVWAKSLGTVDPLVPLRTAIGVAASTATVSSGPGLYITGGFTSAEMLVLMKKTTGNGGRGAETPTLLRLDPSDGTIQWAKGLPPAYGVGVDYLGMVYVGGVFTKSVNFASPSEPSNPLLASSVNGDLYLARIVTGNDQEKVKVVQASRYGGKSTARYALLDLVVDKYSNIYWGGKFAGGGLNMSGIKLDSPGSGNTQGFLGRVASFSSSSSSSAKGPATAAKAIIDTAGSATPLAESIVDVALSYAGPESSILDFQKSLFHLMKPYASVFATFIPIVHSPSSSGVMGKTRRLLTAPKKSHKHQQQRVLDSSNRCSSSSIDKYSLPFYMEGKDKTATAQMQDLLQRLVNGSVALNDGRSIYDTSVICAVESTSSSPSIAGARPLVANQTSSSWSEGDGFSFFETQPGVPIVANASSVTGGDTLSSGTACSASTQNKTWTLITIILGTLLILALLVCAYQYFSKRGEIAAAVAAASVTGAGARADASKASGVHLQEEGKANTNAKELVATPRTSDVTDPTAASVAAAIAVALEAEEARLKRDHAAQLEEQAAQLAKNTLAEKEKLVAEHAAALAAAVRAEHDHLKHEHAATLNAALVTQRRKLNQEHAATLAAALASQRERMRQEQAAAAEAALQGQEQQASGDGLAQDREP